MSVLLDTSALVKLVVVEPESAPLRTYLRDRPRRVASALVRVELRRAAARSTPALSPTVEQLLGGLALLRLDDTLLEEAGRLAPAALRSPTPSTSPARCGCAPWRPWSPTTSGWRQRPASSRCRSPRPAGDTVVSHTVRRSRPWWRCPCASCATPISSAPTSTGLSTAACDAPSGSARHERGHGAEPLPFDAMIAAVASSQGLPVYTANPADFRDISGLEVVALPPGP